MIEEVITPRGITQARRSATKSTTRLVTFPDGITRHITLPGWQWAVLDRFDRDGSVVSAARIVEMAFESAQEDSNCPEEPFEQKLRYHLSVGLNEGVCWSSEYIKRRANDC